MTITAKTKPASIAVGRFEKLVVITNFVLITFETLCFFGKIILDPLSILIVALIAFVLSAWFGWITWSTVEIKQPIICPPDTGRILPKEHRYHLALRIVAIILCGVMLLFLGWVLLKLGATATSLAHVTDPFFQGGVMVKDEAGRRIPGSCIVEIEEITCTSLDEMYGSCDQITFAIEKHPQLRWLQIDKIVAHVESYRPSKVITEHSMKCCSLQEELDAYVLELSPQGGICHDEECVARIVSVSRPPVVNYQYISSDVPSLINVVMTAKKPGIYKYSLTVHVSCSWMESDIEIVKSRECAFISRSSDFPATDDEKLQPTLAPPVTDLVPASDGIHTDKKTKTPDARSTPGD